jgi:hypothetical protein
VDRIRTVVVLPAPLGPSRPDAGPDADERFRFGLEVILDGLERRLAR